MAIPKNKTELLDAINTTYTKLRAELATIPPSLTRKQTVIGNISVCDIIAYQIGWGQLLIDWYKAGEKGKIPEMPTKGYRWNQLGALAQKFYDDKKTMSFPKLLSLFDDTVKEIINIINKLDDKELYSIGHYGWTGDKWPLGRWINVNTSSPYKSARTKIRSWKKVKA